MDARRLALGVLPWFLGACDPDQPPAASPAAAPVTRLPAPPAAPPPAAPAPAPAAPTRLTKGIVETIADKFNDSYGKFSGWRDCGALYKRVPPRVNACKPAGEWQTFDIRLAGRSLNAKQNGADILDVNDVGPRGTGSREVLEDGPGPILFQGDHGAVEFRNVRVRRL